MSVKMSVVRTVQNKQVLVVPFGDDDQPIRTYAYFQAYFTGFPGGARSRMKNFRSQFKLLCYLNKLFQGSWMTDSDYSAAWHAVMELNDDAQSLRILDDIS